MRERNDLRVVAFGGGTGLPVLLSGLRQIGVELVSAVVTVADDGGSSGRLRQELGVAPPGDLRNCLVALAERRRLAEVFDYRFEGGVELRDHSVGNIIIAALADISGGFCEGVEQAGRFLRITGRVLPAATESVTLVVHHADGSVTRGESTVREAGRAVRRVTIEPAMASAPRAVIDAIDNADVAVLSPGSLFTSTIPALLGAGVAEALARFGGPVIYAANVMTQPGETVGFTLSDHLRAITDHVGPVVTDALVHGSQLPAALLARYRADGAAPVAVQRGRVEQLGVELHIARILPDSTSGEIRHDPERLAQAVCRVAATRRSLTNRSPTARLTGQPDPQPGLTWSPSSPAPQA
jgi:uncharacterized cofD-like protein